MSIMKEQRFKEHFGLTAITFENKMEHEVPLKLHILAHLVSPHHSLYLSSRLPSTMATGDIPMHIQRVNLRQRRRAVFHQHLKSHSVLDARSPFLEEYSPALLCSWERKQHRVHAFRNARSCDNSRDLF